MRRKVKWKEYILLIKAHVTKEMQDEILQMQSRSVQIRQTLPSTYVIRLSNGAIKSIGKKIDQIVRKLAE